VVLRLKEGTYKVRGYRANEYEGIVVEILENGFVSVTPMVSSRKTRRRESGTDVKLPSISGLGEVSARGGDGGVSVAVKIQLQAKDAELRQLRHQVFISEEKAIEERQAKRAAETRQEATEAAVQGLMRGEVEEKHLTRAGEKVAKTLDCAVLEASTSNTRTVRLESAVKDALDAGEKTAVVLESTKEEAAAAIADAEARNAEAARARKAERSLEASRSQNRALKEKLAAATAKVKAATATAVAAQKKADENKELAEKYSQVPVL